MTKLAFFDCDSTLSSIEGIDELARLRGPEVLKEVEALTNDAMDGKVPLTEVFGRRIEIIQPDKKSCDLVADLYIKTMEPTAEKTMELLRQDGWEIIILSGGFAPLIQPLATRLGITHIEAVPLTLTIEGLYNSFDKNYPTTRNGGKPEIIRKISEKKSADRIIMVGDGISDLEAKDCADAFIGYGGYTRRPAVESASEHYVTRLEQVLEITKRL